ncbi:TRAP transporter small permease [Pseudactinotalea sp.]|uniref:TRAP transporter small permease n=1 Tax=Pseudactinotalea sp. TaxID=1926260 RepID=UPI003B3B531E
MIKKLERVVVAALKAVSVAAFTLLVVVVVWQVFARQVLSSASPWSEEAARYTFIVLIFLTASLVFIERGHIAVEVFARWLPKRAQRVVALGTEVIVFGFAVWVLVWGGWLIAQNAWHQQMSALPFSVGHVYAVMPVAGVLIAFACLVHVVDLVRGGPIWVISDDEAI